MAEQEQIIMTPEDEAAEEAAFEAGFAGTDVDETPPPAEVAATPDEIVATPEPESPAAEEPPQPEFISKAQFEETFSALRAEHQKTIDKMFGRLGDVQHKLEQARKESAGISPKARERLTKEFPEFAEILFADMPEEPEPGTQVRILPSTPAPISGPGPDVVKTQQAYERKLLTKDHADWELVVNSQEFDAFKSSVLTPEQRAELDSSWDAELIGGRLSEFKAWHAAQIKVKEAEEAKKNRLTSAVTPKGVNQTVTVGGSEDEEQAAMEASFKKR